MARLYKFPGGLKLEGHKGISTAMPISKASIPARLFVWQYLISITDQDVFKRCRSQRCYVWQIVTPIQTAFHFP